MRLNKGRLAGAPRATTGTRAVGRVTRILVVEDNEGDVRLLKAEMGDEAKRFQIQWVSTLAEASDCLARSKIDAVLLDLGLPDSSGLDSVRTLHAAHPHTPIVVLTGLFDEKVGQRAVAEGADDFFVKGEVDIGELLHAVDYAAARRREPPSAELPAAGWAGHTTDGLLVVDPEGTVKFATPEALALLGCSRGELDAQGFEPLVMRGNAGVVERSGRKVGIRVDAIDWDGHESRLVILSPLT